MRKEHGASMIVLLIALAIEETDMDYTSRGVAYRELGQLDEAIADFTSAIRINPDNVRAFTGRGEAYMAKFGNSSARDDIDNALDDLTRTIDLCSRDPQAAFLAGSARLYRASAHLLAGDNDRAVDDCIALLEMDPAERPSGTHSLFSDLADAFAKGGRVDEAIKWTGRAIELAPDDQTKREYEARLKQLEGSDP